jgi:hypothetical protein
MIHANGAIHAIELPLFFGCTDVVLLTAVAVGLVSAMSQLIFCFRNQFVKKYGRNST